MKENRKQKKIIQNDQTDLKQSLFFVLSYLLFRPELSPDFQTTSLSVVDSFL